ncbi:hypothetical protein INR49_020145 [Caranx melampygus]|nr:hypothetical protein INR49_020145 [Caranx melampygus]
MCWSDRGGEERTPAERRRACAPPLFRHVAQGEAARAGWDYRPPARPPACLRRLVSWFRSIITQLAPSAHPHTRLLHVLDTPSRTGETRCSLLCMELQCYIHPLSSILRGLKSGRYSERLSSFQESVAMDRIQRILGVLQNPHMG